jgi:hypothetical protein
MMHHHSHECPLPINPIYEEPRQRAKPRHIIDQTRDMLHRIGLVERVLDSESSRWDTPAGVVVCTVYSDPCGCGLYLNDEDGLEPADDAPIWDERYFEIDNRSLLRELKPMIDEIVATAMANPY